MRPSKRAALDKSGPPGVMIKQVERIKASIRAKVEHPFRVIKRQFGFVKVRYRGLKKNTAQLTISFALSNLWMVRGNLLQAQAGVRLRCGEQLETVERQPRCRRPSSRRALKSLS